MATPWIIFPTTNYGQPTDKFGANVTQYNTYPNTTGFPQGSGISLGSQGLLFDFTFVQMTKAQGAIAANASCSQQQGNSNSYNVVTAPAAANQIVTAVNDRYGAALISGDIVWMTNRGLATALVAASLTAPLPVANNAASAGQLTTAVAGTNLQGNILLLNTSTTAGAYPVLIT